MPNDSYENIYLAVKVLKATTKAYKDATSLTINLLSLQLKTLSLFMLILDRKVRQRIWWVL